MYFEEENTDNKKTEKHSKFFEDVRQGLMEAIEIEKGNIVMEQREDMPAPTFVAKESDL